MEMMTMREPETEPRSEHREGWVARSIEQQTAKLPSDAFLWAAVGSIAASLVLDQWGFLGLPVHQLNAPRLLGVAMLLGGVVLVRAF